MCMYRELVEKKNRLFSRSLYLLLAGINVLAVLN